MQKIFKPGDKVNGYTIIDYNDETKKYEFVCDECGTKKTGYYYHLMKACEHPITVPEIRRVFRNMISRCYYPKHQSYVNYGMRGITVSDQWLKCPKSFEDWCLENEWFQGQHVDRIDNDQGYSADNCRIVTHQENQNNRRNNVKITAGNMTFTLAEWGRILGYSSNHGIGNYYHSHGEKQTAKYILELLNGKRTIPRSHKYCDTQIKVDGTSRSIADWAKICHIQPKTIRLWITKHGLDNTIERIANGWKSFYSKYITIDNLCLSQNEWSRKLDKNVSYVTSLIKKHGKEEAIRRITEQWHAILAGQKIKKLDPHYKYLTIDNITDTYRGWSRRIEHSPSYVSELITDHGLEEAIRRVTEQWEAIKKNEQ